MFIDRPDTAHRRHKETVHILNKINGQNVFATYKGADGNIVVLKEQRSSGTAIVWTDTLTTVEVDLRDYVPCFLPPVPRIAYDEVSSVIGGVGEHRRWIVALPKKKVTGPIGVIVAGKTDDVKALVSQMYPLVIYKTPCDEDLHAIEIVATHAEQFIARFHLAGMEAIIENPNQQTNSKLGIERFDRCCHMWFNQQKNEAGPLRDTHRWNFSWTPPHWSHIPFNWEKLAELASDLPYASVERLPLPLRNYVATLKRKQDLDASASTSRPVHCAGTTFGSKWSRLMDFKCVTPSLTLAQNVQLLTCGYYITIAPFVDEDTLKISAALCQSYVRHGYIFRYIGGYEQNAAHLGHGARLRTFKNKDQYNLSNLEPRVVNQVYKGNGVILGRGFKGTKSKYHNPSCAKYVTKRRMVRSSQAEEEMRTPRVDELRKYESVCNKQGF